MTGRSADRSEGRDRGSLCLTASARRLRATTPGSAGVSFLEFLTIIVVLGIVLLMFGLYLRPLASPLRTGGQLFEALVMQARSRAIATTSAQRLRPSSNEELIVESAAACDASVWRPLPRMGLRLPTRVRLVDTDWALCFTSRGVASENLIVAMRHPDLGDARIEVLKGGTTRWLR